MKAKLAKRLVFGILGVVVFVIVGFLCNCPQVMADTAVAAGNSGHAAMIVLASLLFAVCWWAGGVTHDWVTALLMVVSWVLFGATEAPVAFASFAGSNVWLVVGVLILAAAVNKTGLLKRVALKILNLFPAKYSAQLVAMMCTGTVCSPLIPSSTAKAVLGSSLALSTADAMGYSAQSKERTGIFMAAWLGFGCTVPAFLTGSTFSYIVKGYMPSEVQEIMTWGNWFIAMIPWLVIFLVLMYIALVFLYRPKDEKPMDKSAIADMARSLGKMSREEIIAAAVLGCCLVLWIFEGRLGVSATVTALLGAIVLVVAGVLTPKDVQSNVPWTLIIFIGCVFCLGSRFTDMGISAWVAALLSPVLSNVQSAFLLIPALFVFVYVVRFFIASQAVVISLGIAVMAPIMGLLGVSPFVVGLMVYMGVNVWFTLYQNTTYLAAYGAMNGTVSQAQAVKACWAYAAVMIVASLVSFPYWQFLGYIA